jgi:hypothetical protein
LFGAFCCGSRSQTAERGYEESNEPRGVLRPRRLFGRGLIGAGAFLSGDDTPSTVGTAGKIGSGTDLSFENSLSYDLIGGGLKAHVGHEVEIIGITSDARLNNRDVRSSAIGSSKQEKTTLTVDSVKMLAAKCRAA